jgi:predicted nucleic acid-binding protein
MWRILDNTVLSNFAGINRPEIVLQLWRESACTTPGVLSEYQKAVLTRKYPSDAWSFLPILDLTPSEQEHARALPASLGLGERECIAVAVHRKGTFVSDDNYARAIASEQGLKLSGTLGIFLAASQQGVLTLADANNLLKTMIAQGYHSPVQDLGEI